MQNLINFLVGFHILTPLRSLEKLHKVKNGTRFVKNYQKKKKKSIWSTPVKRKSVGKKKKRQNLKEICKHIKLHPHVEEWVQDQLTNEGGNFDVDSYPELTNQDLSNEKELSFLLLLKQGRKTSRGTWLQDLHLLTKRSKKIKKIL